jgi:hypothetical protein
MAKLSKGIFLDFSRPTFVHNLSILIDFCFLFLVLFILFVFIAFQLNLCLCHLLVHEGKLECLIMKKLSSSLRASML